MCALINKNDLATAEWLLKRLTRPERDMNNYPSKALLCASFEGSTAFMKLLLDYGADINTNEARIADPRLATALHAATLGSDETKVKLLLDGGINVNSMNESCRNKTALHVAAGMNLAGIAQLLLEYHAAIDKPESSA